MLDRLFMADSGPPDIPFRVILDELGQWPIDREYADHGIEGGWLEYTGCYWVNGQCIFTYTMV